MANSEIRVVERVAKYRQEPRKVPYKLLVEDDKLYATLRKESKGSDKEKLALKSSLISEGQQTPLVVREHGEKYLLIGGYRRYQALKKAKESNVEGFDDEMEVMVTVLYPGEGKDAEAEFEKDCLVRACSDNSNRKDFSVGEKIRIVKRLHEKGVRSERIQDALGLKEQQVERYLLVVCKYPWLSEAFEEHQIKSGDLFNGFADFLLKQKDIPGKDGQEAPRDRASKMLKDRFDLWVIEAKKKLKAKKAEALAEGKKKLEGKKLHLNQFMDKEILNGWFEEVGQALYGDSSDGSEGAEEQGQSEAKASSEKPVANGWQVFVKDDHVKVPKIESAYCDLSEKDHQWIIGQLLDAAEKLTDPSVRLQLGKKPSATGKVDREYLEKCRLAFKGREDDEKEPPKPKPQAADISHGEPEPPEDEDVEEGDDFGTESEDFESEDDSESEDA